MFNADFDAFFSRAPSGGLDQDSAFRSWWKEQVFLRWWDEDWSWEGLLQKKLDNPDCPTLQHHWAEEEGNLISFGGRDWTCFHLPLQDLKGNPSPKAEWSNNAYNNIYKEPLLQLLKNDAADLRGTVFPRKFSFEKIGVHIYANFSSAWFCERASFEGAVLEKGANFENAIFEGGAIFSEARFQDGAHASFNNAIFKGSTDFSGCNFKGGSAFCATIFLSNTTFHGTTFESYAHFHKTRFTKPPDFGEANFSTDKYFGGAEFKDMKFPRESLFVNAKFNNSEWDNVKFGRGANFSLAIFYESKFYNVVFSSKTSFDNTTFDDVTLSKTHFKDNVSFSGCMFKRNISFEGSTFEKDADFSVPQPDQDSTNIRSSFSEISFEGAEFLGDVTFANRRFTHKTSFAEAVFHGLPGFHDARLHQDTDFRGAKFLGTKALINELRESKPKGSWIFTTSWRAWRRQKKVERNKRASQLERAYRTLKLFMQEKRAHNEEGLFFALELECRRLQSTVPLFERWFATLYKGFSGYGESLTRPIFLWLLTQAMFGFVYGWCIAHSNEPEWQDVARFTLEQSVRPFAIWSERYRSAYEQSGGWIANYLGQETFPFLELIASVQAIISLSLIFLFFLALRRRFRMG